MGLGPLLVWLTAGALSFVGLVWFLGWLLTPAPYVPPADPLASRPPAFTAADSRARQDRWIANLPMSGAIEIHRIVDQTMMGSRDNYRVILVDPTAWKAQDYDLRVDAIANLMRARARRFGYADIEVRDGYTDELLGGWRDNHGVYIVGEAP